MSKLLIMASLFWPQKKGGGPPISIMNIVQAIKDKHDIFIISNNHEVGESEPLKGVKSGWNEFDFGKVYYVDYGKHDIKTILNLIEEIKPDVIYENSFFSWNDMLPVCLYKKKNKAVKVITAPRGEFYPDRLRVGETKKHVYKILVRSAGLLKDIYFHVTGEQEKEYTKKFIGVDEDHIYNINNITRISPALEGLGKEPGSIRLVFIARIHPMKNLLNAIRIMKNVKGDVVYDIYGSIEDKEYWTECESEISQLPPNIEVNYCGMVEHDEITKVLSNYHMFFMPTVGENYGHSIAEALCCGVPVIISDKTPWTDINDNNCGAALGLSNVEKFADVINEYVSMNDTDYRNMSKSAKEYISRKTNTANTIKQYCNMFV